MKVHIIIKRRLWPFNHKILMKEGTIEAVYSDKPAAEAAAAELNARKKTDQYEVKTKVVKEPKNAPSK